MSYKTVPITAAKRIAKEYEKTQVIILCWDKQHNRTHITTYGVTKEDCKQAAEGGNKIAGWLGWNTKKTDETKD